MSCSSEIFIRRNRHPLDTSVSVVLLSHYRRYPAMQLVDVYKLVHQASLSSEHAVTGRDAAQRWLLQELAGLGPGPDEPLPDPIAPDGCLMRIHLRPFLAQGGDPAVLLHAFLRTADQFQGSLAVLESYWAGVLHLAGDGDLPFSPAGVQAFGQEMAARNYPAARHSEVYRAAYRPAYRLVASDFW